MKNGLIYENGDLVYYKDDRPKHAGCVKIDGDIYYIGSGGKAVKGQHVVHREMTNGILERGTYTFGDDYKLVAGSYIAPKKRKKSKKKAQKSTSFILPFVAAFVILIVGALITLVELGIIEPFYKNGEKLDNSVSKNNEEMVLPDFDEEVLLCSTSAKKLYDGKLTVSTAKGGGDPYAPLIFNYNLPEKSGTLKISEHSDLSGGREYVLSSSENSITIDNLKTATRYYYAVTVGREVYEGSFKTAESTRFLYIPGVVNVRDIGGYKTLDGEYIKQNMIIRGPELDGLGDPDYFLESGYAEKVKNEFGFVYEMDLRAETTFVGEYVSRLGEKVGHDFYNASFYGGIFTDSGRESLKKIFSDLAKPENYPMYIHCTYGADRTGTVVFLIQGILNMSQNDMIREYQMTGFYNSSFSSSANMDIIINGLEGYEGDTLGEKIESFLTDTVGVTKEEIESIRNILLED